MENWTDDAVNEMVGKVRAERDVWHEECEEARSKLDQVTTLLELALDSRSSATERGDPLDVAMRAHNAIKRLRKVKTDLLDAILDLRIELEAED